MFKLRKTPASDYTHPVLENRMYFDKIHSELIRVAKNRVQEKDLYFPTKFAKVVLETKRENGKYEVAAAKTFPIVQETMSELDRVLYKAEISYRQCSGFIPDEQLS